jgi:hypothetical protein
MERAGARPAPVFHHPRKQEQAARQTNAGLCPSGGDPAEAIPASQAFLEVTGVNDYSIFPDLEGLKNETPKSAPTN